MPCQAEILSCLCHLLLVQEQKIYQAHVLSFVSRIGQLSAEPVSVAPDSLYPFESERAELLPDVLDMSIYDPFEYLRILREACIEQLLPRYKIIRIVDEEVEYLPFSCGEAYILSVEICHVRITPQRQLR